MTPSMLDPEPTAKLAFQWELKRIGVFFGGGAGNGKKIEGKSKLCESKMKESFFIHHQHRL